MFKQGCFILILFFLISCLSGCLGALWSGATLAYDRHNVYKKLDDYNLIIALNDALAVNGTFKNSETILDIAVFNKDILVAGHVPSQELYDELQLRLSRVKGYRRLFNKVTITQIPSSSIQDSWITMKIRSQIFADASIDPNAFKVVTSDHVVYLMGDVKPEQADKVIKIARFTSGVRRVEKLMKYYTYQLHSNMA
ncbi:hemolysin [Legionella norrlandica]|uniref:Hemolysin n=1 Tax=Legionella norrlandica TaxID=1498499 RepID=A0A0A2SVL6_9GAMM|nr:BON domain-containing protein [Legionella norrlandica]KGP63771.1 hemolysin [Legionella norrlandica]